MTFDCSLSVLPRYLAISDHSHPRWPGWRQWVKGLRALDVLVQAREKDLETDGLWRRCRWIDENLKAPIVVNSRSDVAWSLGLRGVHLTSTGYPVSAVRRYFGPNFLIGRSTHHLSEVLDAERGGADYVTFSPIFSSPGKGPPQGIDALREVAQVGIPVFALGGISWENIEIIKETGAWGIAGIRLFFELPTTSW